MTTQRIMLIAVAALVSSAFVARGQALLIRNDGTRIQGEQITANRQGDLQVTIGGGAQTTYRRGTYRKVYTPEPTAVKNLQRAYELERYELVLERGPEIYDQYKYLGWGGKIGHLLGRAHLEQGNAQKALQLLEDAAKFAELQMNEDEQMAELNTGRVAALLELDRVDEAQKILTQLKGAEGDDVAAFAFTASARLFKKQGKNREAVLEYMKAVLLFEPGQVPEERKRAKEELVALLQEMNDPRYQSIKDMK